MLSDVEISAGMLSGQIVIDPPPLNEHLQPASIDVHLGNKFGQLVRQREAVLLTDPSEVVYFEAEELRIAPGEFYLGQLAQRVRISEWYVARIEGKSSNGRRGLAIHVTAGFVDPGWDGYLTVELFNAGPNTLLLCSGDPIGQLAFDRLETPARRPYGHPELKSHYQGSDQVRGGT